MVWSGVVDQRWRAQRLPGCAEQSAQGALCRQSAAPPRHPVADKNIRDVLRFPSTSVVFAFVEFGFSRLKKQSQSQFIF